MKDQTPRTRNLVDRANTLFRVYLATENSFPDIATVESKTLGCYHSACDILGEEYVEWKSKNHDIVTSIVSLTLSYMKF